MGNVLVVVESPAKAKTIRKYLGPDFTVKASLGHVKDLPKQRLGVDVERDFEPEYEVIRGKAPLLKELRTAARKADRVFLATDPDREGEAIAFHLAEELGGARSPKIGRVLFNEITRRAVQEAVRKPLPLDAHKFESQQARRILDRLVGYRISPLLWDKIRRGLSAGRVQSVAVRLIVEREDEIARFVAREYWTLDAHLAAAVPPEFRARLVKVDGKKPEVPDEAAARALEAALAKEPYVVDKVEQRERRRPPPPPYATSRLQQDASTRLKLDAKRTMKLAQQLYEGVELGPAGSVGLITYMRTDSTRVSKEAVDEARAYIAKTFGADHLPPHANEYKAKAAAQDAHEAIRPTSMAHTPEQ
ncbi:MAG: type I DNA topoisomerase, partial [Myxococcales bacterium]